MILFRFVISHSELSPMVKSCFKSPTNLSKRTSSSSSSDPLKSKLVSQPNSYWENPICENKTASRATEKIRRNIKVKEDKNI